MRLSVLAVSIVSALLMSAAVPSEHYLPTAAETVIPSPVFVEAKKGAFIFEKTLLSDAYVSPNTYTYLKKRLYDEFRIELRNIRYGQEASLIFEKNRDIVSEGYKIDITKKRIKIEASSDAGFFYGATTLLQLMEASHGEQTAVAAQSVTDYPRFGYRSVMLDTGSDTLDMKKMTLLLDRMSDLKLNTLHWKLTDADKWRFEVKQYPFIGTELFKQSDIRRLVDYAAERHIKIIPHIEIPSYAQSILTFYPWLGYERNDDGFDRFIDGYKSLYDVSNPRTVDFLKNVIEEAVVLFGSGFVHIGGEVSSFASWERNPKIVSLLERKGYGTSDDLRAGIAADICSFVAERSGKVIGMSDITASISVKDKETANNNDNNNASHTPLPADFIIQFEHGDGEAMTAEARKGFYMINTCPDTDFESVCSFEPLPEQIPTELRGRVIGVETVVTDEWSKEGDNCDFTLYSAACAELGWCSSRNRNGDRLKKILSSEH